MATNIRKGKTCKRPPVVPAGAVVGEMLCVDYSQGTVRVMPTEAKNFLQSVVLAAVVAVVSSTGAFALVATSALDARVTDEFSVSTLAMVFSAFFSTFFSTVSAFATFTGSAFAGSALANFACLAALAARSADLSMIAALMVRFFW